MKVKLLQNNSSKSNLRKIIIFIDETDINVELLPKKSFWKLDQKLDLIKLIQNY